jgi:endonuclease YncB( thermonuclease family)
MYVRLCLVIGLFALGVIPTLSAAGKWKVYEDATLIKNDFNDGDSFHVMCGKYHYIFRLYYVDTPETSASYPDRVQAQADYFDITFKEALKIGDDATRFTDKLLSRKSFTVYTKKEDARGNSKRKRYFAMIKIGDDWLSTLLVENGLARVYGMRTDLPDNGKPIRKYSARLKARERTAKKEHKGAWKYSKKK